MGLRLSGEGTGSSCHVLPLTQQTHTPSITIEACKSLVTKRKYCKLLLVQSHISFRSITIARRDRAEFYNRFESQLVTACTSISQHHKHSNHKINDVSKDLHTQFSSQTLIEPLCFVLMCSKICISIAQRRQFLRFSVNHQSQSQIHPAGQRCVQTI